MRSSGRSGAPEGRRRWAGVTALVALLPALCTSSLRAQSPSLPMAEGPAVRGISLDGIAAYPLTALERLGFTIAMGPAGATAVVDTDTLRFWATSPFFRAGTELHQLAFPVRRADETFYLPEQFFIRWLPAAFPNRFAFSNGTLLSGSALASASAAAANAGPHAGAARADVNATSTAEPGPDPHDDARIVVIDPGHGGPDPGAIGPNGLREKDVTLLISQRLAGVLKERGYEVHLTRTTDTLVALSDRPRLANRWRGDRPVALFLSIHTNSVTARSARGFETFFLSEAQTEDERRVAEMENEAVRFEEEPAVTADEGLDLILSNLRNDFLMRASHDLASTVQGRLGSFHPGPDRGVKRGGLIVLIGSIMPAVLIEAGFISNPAEADLLGSQAFQQKLAWGIADAVDEFFSRNEHLWAHRP